MQVRVSDKSPIITCLLEGKPGSGKSALAATVALESKFPFMKLVSAEAMVAMSTTQKCAAIHKVKPPLLATCPYIRPDLTPPSLDIPSDILIFIIVDAAGAD